MTDFLKIAKSIVVHFAHICAYGVETVKVLNHASRTPPRFPYTNLKKSRTEKKLLTEHA